ncbi:acireductone synthase [Streptomyces sp. CA-111067]|uniref:acireductone synthase n=1 Tax=Streptomyces sp. CA-111067 TaxID=3240046 RepID=UPI003D951758
MVRAVVLDIEGTVSSARYAERTLFPYAHRRIPGRIRRGGPEIAAIAGETRLAAGLATADRDEITAALQHWSSADEKVAPLKTLQGLIWEEGFAAGELAAHVYEDVPPALAAWRRQGLGLHIYSSGSVAAQRAWFGHTAYGDLLPYFGGHFDLRNAGAKDEPDSYLAIARALGESPGDLLFLSDAQRELDAARAAGWHTVGVRRPDDEAAPPGGHLVVPGLNPLTPLPSGFPEGMS